MLKENQINQLKEELLSQREELTINKDEAEKLSHQESVGELSTYDNHPADLGTELFEREKDLAIDNHTNTELDKIEAALNAIKDETYGKCKECGNDIPFERLEVVPSALYCIEHTPDRSLATDRPVEEDLLGPVKSDTFVRDTDPRIEDDRDSFGEVASFGTSETPSDYTGDHDNYDNLYDNDKESDSFTEHFEEFAANDIDGSNKKVFPSKTKEHFEETLDEENIESPIGNIPYKKNGRL